MGIPNDEKEKVCRLRASLDSSSKDNRNFLLIFITFLAYVAIIAAGTTDEMLLRNSPVNMPLLNIQIPLHAFYLIAPALVIIVHLDFLINLNEHSAKLRRVKELGAFDKEETHPFVFNVHETYPIRRPIGILIRVINWTTTYWVAPITLTIILYKFLPYHEAGTTYWHEAAIFVDLALVDIYRSQIRFGNARRMILLRRGPVLMLALCFIPFYVLLPLATPHIGEKFHNLHFNICAKRGKLFEKPGDAIVAAYLNNGKTPDDEDGIDFGRGISLHDRDLRFANFERADLRKGEFQDADMYQSNLTSANLQKAKLINTRLDYANLNKAKLQEAKLYRAELNNANLKEAQLQGASLSWAQLSAIDFYNAKLQGAIFKLANIQGANFLSARLQGADLWLAELQGADLQKAQLQGANLTGAKLQGTNLSDAKFQGADLTGALMKGADTTGAEFKDNLCYDIDYEKDETDWQALINLTDSIKNDQDGFAKRIDEAVKRSRRNNVDKNMNKCQHDEGGFINFNKSLACNDSYVASHFLNSSNLFSTSKTDKKREAVYYEIIDYIKTSPYCEKIRKELNGRGVKVD